MPRPTSARPQGDGRAADPSAPADDAVAPANPRPARKGSLRAAQRAFTRARFIDSAVLEFAERGYARTTIDDIVSRAGATRATFYLHFRTKTDILVELNERTLAIFDGMFGELGAIARDPTPAAVRGWFHRQVEVWPQARHLVAPLWDGAAIDQDIRVVVEQGYEQQVRILAEALLAARENLRPDDAELTAEILLTTLRRFFERYVRGQLGDPERMIAVLTSAWISVIRDAGSQQA
ncbi:TetR/AcrR family transcriptional regulator [Pseudofrankia inefficax]|uniref:Regulatory protein TetR n=1 Tax=Pseudofrankia inefficax (strain DSM 45817 / CECT 9037 / DDB 130130 / EuI1c) TaxID=298654 RepID=E3IXX0_PSEI1|nr:TetR/AcrR family transcriptional regulator [Pseudofrankia inefficax]ADP81425.1 regulatory protein TetR [Pseudofrankia inefficax]